MCDIPSTEKIPEDLGRRRKIHHNIIIVSLRGGVPYTVPVVHSNCKFPLILQSTDVSLHTNQNFLWQCSY